MAKLYFYYASMNAGKSTNLLQANFNYGERGMATMLWTAALDNRTEQPIASRIGLGADASRFGPGTNLYEAVMVQHAETPLACVLILFGMTIHFTPANLGQRLALQVRLLPAWALGLLVGVTILIVDAMRFEGVAPFIYYQF